MQSKVREVRKFPHKISIWVDPRECTSEKQKKVSLFDFRLSPFNLKFSPSLFHPHPFLTFFFFFSLSFPGAYPGGRTCGGLAFYLGLELRFVNGPLTYSSAFASLRSASCFALVITISRLRRSWPHLVK